MRNSNGEKDFDLTCWYLNLRRVAELTGFGRSESETVASISGIDEQLRKLWLLSNFKERISDWARAANPPSLEMLILQGKLTEASIVTHFSTYNFKGLSNVRKALDRRFSTVPLAEAYCKLDSLRAGLRVKFQFSHEHLTSTSAWVELSLRKKALVIGVVREVSDTVVELVPYVIAYPFVDLLDDAASFVGKRWAWRLETFIEQIEPFQDVSKYNRPASAKNLAFLRSIPESEIKQAFAEILGEPTVPKDWGGERSDLFSTHVVIDGRRVSTAFVLKGPAKFHPMTLADLGKNGDQIDRLFSEPADLMVLQHCHEITSPVRSMMRAYAERLGRPKSFCIIDGYDTLRILGAYGKCGAKPT